MEEKSLILGRMPAKLLRRLLDDIAESVCYSGHAFSALKIRVTPIGAGRGLITVDLVGGVCATTAAFATDLTSETSVGLVLDRERYVSLKGKKIKLNGLSLASHCIPDTGTAELSYISGTHGATLLVSVDGGPTFELVHAHGEATVSNNAESAMARLRPIAVISARDFGMMSRLNAALAAQSNKRYGKDYTRRGTGFVIRNNTASVEALVYSPDAVAVMHNAGELSDGAKVGGGYKGTVAFCVAGQLPNRANRAHMDMLGDSIGPLELSLVDTDVVGPNNDLDCTDMYFTTNDKFSRRTVPMPTFVVADSSGNARSTALKRYNDFLSRVVDPPLGGFSWTALIFANPADFMKATKCVSKVAENKACPARGDTVMLSVLNDRAILTAGGLVTGMPAAGQYGLLPLVHASVAPVQCIFDHGMCSYNKGDYGVAGTVLLRASALRAVVSCLDPKAGFAILVNATQFVASDYATSGAVLIRQGNLNVLLDTVARE